MEIGIISIESLPEDKRLYLLSLEAGKNRTPVYFKSADGVFLVQDHILTNNKVFEATAPQGLYRGGALLKILTKEGQVVIYDERYKWLRLIGGIARYDEGIDLTKTAVREAVVEELSVLTNGEKTRLVPAGTSGMVGLSIESWGITAEEIEETGSLSEVTYFFNEKNRAFEIVIQWDISDRDNLILLHSEDWFRGGRSGFIPFVINDKGEVIGLYDGRHGYIPMPVSLLHPTLKEVL